MTQIAAQIYALTKAATSADELFRTIDRHSAIDPMSTSGLTPDCCLGSIKFQNLDFAYPSRPGNQVLKELSLVVPAKEKTALVGASGSGKSTIVALLERWYDQAAGTVLLDGVDHRKLNIHWLRTHIRLVQQEPVLFSGTIFDNVAHGLLGTVHENCTPEKKMELVQNACIDAFAHDFIERLPEQYSTRVGERARMLSGGQKQRIAIARSIISNPPILLLDEATSALDPRSEKIVQQALDNVSLNRTTITIAHKLSTVQKADNIAVMSQGTLVEQGTHAQLLARSGAYAKLVHAQKLDDPSKRDSDDPEESDKQLENAGAESKKDQQPLRRMSTIKQTASVPASIRTLLKTGEEEFKESMGYGLIRCLYLMIKEQPTLWHLYSIIGTTVTFGGKLRQPTSSSKPLTKLFRWHACSPRSPFRAHFQCLPDDGR